MSLALLGGSPIRPEPLPQYNTIGCAEKEAAMAVLDSGILSDFVAQPNEYFNGGREIIALERAWCEKFRVKHSISVNSATTGLLAALYAAGVGPGDEVILPPQTMTGCAAAIMFCGAVPVFADVNPDTLLLDPAAYAAAISPRTRAVMPVHLAGLACDMDSIVEIARQHGIRVIEDNAQGPGSTYKRPDRYLGTIGDLGVFSLNCHKTIQCGEGGIVCTNDDDLALRVQFMRNHGENAVGKLGDPVVHKMIGLNLRMTEVTAAIARCQLEKLDELNAPRIFLANLVAERMRKISGITPMPERVPPGCTNVYYVHLYRYDEAVTGIPIRLFAEAVTAEGIPLYADWAAPIYSLSVYNNRSAFHETGYPWSHPAFAGVTYAYGAGTCPVADNANRYTLCSYNVLRWPFGPEIAEQFVSAIEKVLSERSALLEFAKCRGQ
jgi:perosamine synthetase